MTSITEAARAVARVLRALESADAGDAHIPDLTPTGDDAKNHCNLAIDLGYLAIADLAGFTPEQAAEIRAAAIDAIKTLPATIGTEFYAAVKTAFAENRDAR